MWTVVMEMWQGDHKITLAEIVAAIPPNDLTWTVLEFDGWGRFPDGMAWSEFHERVLNGLRLSWQELQKFAEGLDDTKDCVIAATTEDGTPDYGAIINGICDSAKVVIMGTDSTDWELTFDDDLAEAIKLPPSRLDRPTPHLRRGPAQPLD